MPGRLGAITDEGVLNGRIRSLEHRRLGATDLHVSPIGLGTVQIGMPYGIGKPVPPADEECIGLLHRACEAGINYIDTAAGYGRSEELVGKAFARFIPRPVIATKVTLRRNQQDPENLRGAILTKHIEESVLRSLKNLGCETLDLLQLHVASDSFIVSELLESMDDLSSRGLVRYWGASTYGLEAPMEALADPDRFYTLQVAYNILDRRQEDMVIPRCKEQGVGLVLRSVFFYGALSDRAYTLPDSLSGVRTPALRAAQVAASAGISLPALALRYAAFFPQPCIALCGTTSIEEIEGNIAAFEAGPLPGEIREDLDDLKLDDDFLLNPGNWDV